ncbi:MAG: methyltransferase domain-containing protein [Saprospiraceae bacterium]
MQYKFLFPTYRNRYCFIRDTLKEYGKDKKFFKGLNLGTGEGDYDSMIAEHCESLLACDINEADLVFARHFNQDVPNLSYQVENALHLSFPDNHFDLIISVEVIEHVGEPQQMMAEISRVLKPGGLVLMTFPSLEFPFTYDPINRILSWFSDRHLSQGAFAFGHEYLISPPQFREWVKNEKLELLRERNLSGYIVGILEMYWTGWVQQIFKVNAVNVSDQAEKRLALRPSKNAPKLTVVTDAILSMDFALFKNSSRAIGKGIVLTKTLL